MAKRKIVDAHHHLWELSKGYKYPWLQDRQSGEGMLGDLRPIVRDYELQAYRADVGNYDLVKSVHVEAVPIDGSAETRWLQGISADGGLPSALIGRVELHRSDAESLIADQCNYSAVRGIRHIINWHENPRLSFTDHHYLEDSAWLAGFKLLRKYHLSFDLQIYPGQMDAAASLAAHNPDTLIILNHTGMPVDRDEAGFAVWRAGMKHLAAQPNVVAKISGLGMVDHNWSEATIRPLVLETIEIFGAERAMFASNFPVDRLYSTFDALYGAFERIVGAFSETEKAKLFHDNAIRLYRL
jgi:predicted TIM-barrel fold metal-dependent hydrolase